MPHHAAGRVLVQWHPPAWFDAVDSVPRQAGPVEIAVGPRIGITKAADRPWRYGLAGSPFMSRPFRPAP